MKEEKFEERYVIKNIFIINNNTYLLYIVIRKLERIKLFFLWWKIIFWCPIFSSFIIYFFNDNNS